MGNLDSIRDWGHARDYVEAMWLMLQKSTPRDYVIASGESHSVRDFVEEAFLIIGISLTWIGNGLREIGIDANGIVRVKISDKFFRPAEVNHLQGDSSLARKELGWSPTTSFKMLVKEMVMSDLELLGRDPSG